MFITKNPKNRIHSPGSLRQTSRECVALGALAMFLNAQCILPLSYANAQTLPPRQAATNVQPRVAQAETPRPRPGRAPEVKPKEADKETTDETAKRALSHGSMSMERLDLNQVPSEARLRASGGQGGELTPLGNADVERFKEILAQKLETGTPRVFDADNAELFNTPAGKAIFQGRERVKLLEKINLGFGKFVRERNEANFKVAARLAQEHLENFPESPWAGEAMLHLGIDAQYNGRPGEAASRFKAVLDVTSIDPTDPTYELHQKAAAAMADLNISLGQWEQAAIGLRDLAANDTSPARRTWAVAWLSRIGTYKSNVRFMVACGSEALGFMLASMGRDKAAKKVEHLPAPRAAGFNLEELARLSARNGVPLRGFRLAKTGRNGRALVRDLAALPTPFLVHYDIPQSAAARKYAVLAQKIAVWGPSSAASCCHPVDGKVVCPPVHGKPTNRKSPALPANLGHFLVVKRIDAATGNVDLHDPQNGAPITVTAEQFAREWSGSGLAPAKTAAPVRLAGLTRQEMARIHGGCCCIPRIPDDGGPNPNCQPGNGGGPPCGSPQWQVNRLTMNLYVQDIPIWYNNAMGPNVEISLHYNSQDAEYRGPTFGNKWHLSLMTSIVEMPNGWVYLNLPGGGVDIYVPGSGSTYVARDADVHNTLVKVAGYAHRFELTAPTGEKTIYDVPTGISTPYPYMVEQRDRWGSKLTYGYELQTISSSPLVQVIHIKTITDQASPARVTNFTYNSNGNCTQVKDPFGRTATFTYDADGNMASCTDMGGNKFEYFYDQKPNGTPFTDWNGNAVKLSLLSRIRSNRGDTVFEHQVPFVSTNPADQGAVYASLSATHPNGLIERFRWNADTHNEFSPVSGGGVPFGSYAASYKNGAGNEVVQQVRHFIAEQVVDGAPKITAVKSYSRFIYYPDFGYGSSGQYLLRIEQMGYDPGTGELLTFTDGNGNTTRYAYNALGKVTRLQDAKGYVTQYNYDPTNLVDVTSVVDNRNRVTMSASYDSYHQAVLMTQDPAGLDLDTTATYTTWGTPSTITNAKGETTTFNYNSTTRQMTSISVSSPTQSAVQIASATYDAVGRPRTVVDAYGLSRTFEYNDLDKPVKVVYPDGSLEVTDYLCCALPGVETDRSGRKTYYDYDEAFRLRRVQDPQGNTLQMDYDPVGNLVQMIDSRGSTTRWNYNALGQQIRKTYTDGTGESYAYDRAGNIYAARDARGILTKYEHDVNNQLTKVDYTNDSLTAPVDDTFVYDDLNRLTSMTDRTGTTTWNYDSAGRRNGEDGPYSNDTVSWTFDELNRRRTFQNNGAFTRTFSYDFLGRLDTLVAPMGTWDWSYSDPSNLPSLLVAPNATRTSYAYDSLERLTAVNNRKSNGTTILSDFGFVFDNTNKRDARWKQTRQWLDSSSTLSALQTVTFGYDNTNQLQGETSGETNPLVKLARTFDSMGNRLTETDQGRDTPTTGIRNISRSYTSNRLNQLTSVGTTYTDTSTGTNTLTYDARGNLIKQDDTKQTTYTQYTYDENNRLLQIMVRQRTGNVPVHLTTFYYDGVSRKRRSLEQVWDIPSSSFKDSKRTDFAYDGMDVVREQEQVWGTPGNNGTIISSVYLLTRVGNISGLLCRTKQVTGQPDRHAYYAYDGSGNVSTVTDGSQNVKCSYTYNAFGPSTVDEASGWEQPWRYSTKWLHGASGLYDYGFRFYAPSLGTWINRDPIQEMGGTNLYGFVGNSPTNLVDANGNIPILIPVITGVIGGAIGGGANFAIQYFKSGGRLDCIDLWSVAFSAAGGAIAGAATPFVGTSLIGAAGLNGWTAVGSNWGYTAVTQGVSSINAKDTIMNAGFGAAGGVFGALPKGWTPVRGVNPFVDSMRQLFRRPISPNARFWDRQVNLLDELGTNFRWYTVPQLATATTGSSYPTTTPLPDCKCN